MLQLYISVAPDEHRPRIEISLPGNSGTVHVGLAAVEERPGGFYWLQVAIPLWYRNVEPDPPYTESVMDIEILTWVPVDSVVPLRNADYQTVVAFLNKTRFPDVRFLRPGAGRPEGAPRFPFPWEESDT